MCKVYNQIGSITTLKQHLDRNDIYDFKSLKEIISFQNSYSANKQQIIYKHKNLIEQEKVSLQTELEDLSLAIQNQKRQAEIYLNDEINQLKQQLNTIPKNLFQKLKKYFQQYPLVKKINHKEQNFNLEVNKHIKNLTNLQQDKNDRLEFINSHFENAVKQSYNKPITELDRKKTTIDQLSSFIYGAFGEQKVVKTLESLSDEYYLINDFTITFSKAIYNRQEGDYIKSVQIDHILVAPSGIFLIETKNWSEKSLENLSLRSPVQQIKRTSFVLFKLLNNDIGDYNLRLDKHHWGDKKISIKNLIVLMNTKPKEEFQFVKILTINELLGYVNYFKPIFSNSETQKIADFLININSQKTIWTNQY